jgi:tetratricopeptide (TPR) repeat protein
MEREGFLLRQGSGGQVSRAFREAADMTVVATVRKTLAVVSVLAVCGTAAGQQTTPFEEQVLKLDRPAALAQVRQRPDEARAALERLQKRFDASVHSARDVPEQRKVQFDEQALDQGLALGRLLTEATQDSRFERLFAARKKRIDGTMQLNARKPAEAVATLEQALAEARALEDTWLEIITRTNLAYGYLELEDPARALAECERANTIAEKADARSHALTLFNLASVHMHLRRFEDSIPIARQAIGLARQVGNRLWEGNLLLNIGVAEHQLKRLPAALATLSEARDVLDKTQDKLGQGRAAFNLALVKGDSGDSRGAVAEMERALPFIRGTDIRHSHHIEEDPGEYYNSIEEAALRLLVTWYGQLGDAAKRTEHQAALDSLVSRKPAAKGHSHR